MGYRLEEALAQKNLLGWLRARTRPIIDKGGIAAVCTQVPYSTVVM